jgi:two-component system nitrogen regulation sensor histidine kinase NtrY
LALEIFNEEFIQFQCEEKNIFINIDKTQINRVITNLVKNAIQAIPEEQEQKAILVRVYSNEKDIIISISDNGIGVDADISDKIFEPKFTTKSSGMGLGLGIIKKIIENYNGAITFVSKEKIGTTFTIQLPKNNS